MRGEFEKSFLEKLRHVINFYANHYVILVIIQKGRSKMKVGFVGIGAMGRHMSRHVVEAGYELVVNDIRKEAAQELLFKEAR
jgi:uncharacterized UPF0146 family protein